MISRIKSELKILSSLDLNKFKPSRRTGIEYTIEKLKEILENEDPITEIKKVNRLTFLKMNALKYKSELNGESASIAYNKYDGLLEIFKFILC